MRTLKRVVNRGRRILELIGLRKSPARERMAERVRQLTHSLSERGVRVNTPYKSHHR